MLTKTKNLIAFFLLMVLMITSAGIPIHTHICYSKGITDVSILQLESCCNKKACAITEVSENCCDNSSVFLKYEPLKLSSNDDENIRILAASVQLLPVSIISEASGALELPAPIAHAPPILNPSTKDFLSYIQVYLI